MGTAAGATTKTKETKRHQPQLQYSSYITDKTRHFHYEDQAVNTVMGSNPVLS
jgi:hypothetical protein